MKVDFVLFADAAQEVGGKLYLMGGGFTILRVAAFPAADFPLGFAVGVLVDPDEMGIDQSVSIRFADEDDSQVIPTVTVNFRVTQTEIPDAPGRIILALNGRVTLLRPGRYTISVKAGESNRSSSFWATLAGPKIEMLAGPTATAPALAAPKRSERRPNPQRPTGRRKDGRRR